MSVFFIGRGDCRLGTVRRDAAGNVVEKTDAKWEPNDEGGCVAICAMDPDKMEPVGAAEVFGDWDAGASCQYPGFPGHPEKGNGSWRRKRFLL